MLSHRGLVALTKNERVNIRLLSYSKLSLNSRVQYMHTHMKLINKTRVHFALHIMSV